MASIFLTQMQLDHPGSTIQTRPNRQNNSSRIVSQSNPRTVTSLERHSQSGHTNCWAKKASKTTTTLVHRSLLVVQKKRNDKNEYWTTKQEQNLLQRLVIKTSSSNLKLVS